MSSLKIRWILVLFEACAAIGIAFFAGLTIWMAGPTIESRFFPVATKLNITMLTSHPAGTQIEAATFTKIRDCEFLGISWFHRLKDGTIERVSLLPKNLAQSNNVVSELTRPVGRNLISGPWLVSLPLQETIYHSFARIHHKCHPYWTTVTDFYP